MPGQNLIFYGTTGPSGAAHGNSQPNPAQWLGRYRASQTLHSLQSTLTHDQATTSRHYLRDTARIGDGANAHVFKWLLIQTGPASLSAARVEAFDSATGMFKLDRRTSANALTGNSYALFSRNNVWPDVTAQQALQGDVRYRCIFFRNQHGVAITNLRFYLVPLMTGGGDFDRISSRDDIQDLSGVFLERANDTTDILNALGNVDRTTPNNGFESASGWVHPYDRATAFSENASLANNFGSPIWLRRTIPTDCTRRRSVAVMLVATTDLAGSDPDPLVGACIMPYDILGTPAGGLEIDRFVGVSGGCRLNARVFESSTGLPYAEYLRFELSSGDLGEIAVDGDPIVSPGVELTDEQGEAFATFRADDLSAAGETVTPRVVIPAGDEVADPVAPLQISFSGTVELAHDATLFTSPNEQTYDDEQGAGFLPGI